MKRFLPFVLLCGLMLGVPAWAALSVTTADCNTASGSTNPLTVSLLGSVASGNAIAVEVYNWSGESITVSDPSNGTYSAAYSYNTSFGGGLGWWWVKTTATGTPTISITNPSANYLEVSVCPIVGFTGTPTLDTGLENHFTGATTTVSASPLTTGQNTEMMLFGLAAPVSGTAWSSAPAGWTDQLGPTTIDQLTAYEATSGTTNNISGTLSTTQSWYGLSLGIYDASGGASCTHAGFTAAGALAVPNGTTGSYLGKTGGFVTPDCSTVNYWQPTVGNFGVN